MTADMSAAVESGVSGPAPDTGTSPMVPTLTTNRVVELVAELVFIYGDASVTTSDNIHERLGHSALPTLIVGVGVPCLNCPMGVIQDVPR